jgi:putative oxidoreductase
MTIDFALLILRIVVGFVLFAHGAQKLFGWFGGHGLKGTGGWLASMGLQPASLWALLAGLAEAGGGILMALGLFNPIGPLGVIAAMLTAISLVHWGKGLWATGGGMELPLTNIAGALAVALAGTGRYSLDALLGISLPEPATFVVGLVLVILGVIASIALRSRQTAAAH